MVRHASDLILSLQKDRVAGLSISELMRKYSLSKTTVWYHVRNIQLSEKLLSALRSRQGSSPQRSKKEWERAQEYASELLVKATEETIWVALLAALYWSEGTKKSGFVFTNTDPVMIKVFLKILREKLNIQNKDLDILVRTSTPMNIVKCRKFWATVTSIPYKDIRINHDDLHNKSKTENGMCRITLRKGGYHLKLMHCLIAGIAGKIIDVQALP